jgi:WD40 repeat protein
MFSADGKRIASGLSYRMVTIWDTKSGSYLRTLDGYESLIASPAFSFDNKEIALGAGDETIMI